ncbi:MAG: acyltransferase family protein [Rhodomicrobium sp.]
MGEQRIARTNATIERPGSNGRSSIGTDTNVVSQSAYRPEIDGLRALAVIAVIINHFDKSILPSGYLGVDIFFVVSGFVISSSLADYRSKNFGDFLLGFYVRRIKRLIPALVLVVVVTGVLICLFNPTPKASLNTGMAALFGLSNFELLKQSADYFGVATELNVFAHTWSLGVEEQFYFLYPFLFWFSGFGRLSANGSRNLLLVTGSLTVASLIGFVLLYPASQPTAYFSMPSRLWELGAGCLLFLGLKHPNAAMARFRGLPPLLVAAGIVGVLFVPLEFAVPATVAVVALTAALIACIRPGTVAYNIFTRRQAVYIGLISYSLYLWHWGVLSLSRWSIGIHWWSVPFQTACMFLLAAMSYRFIETPLRRSSWSGKRLFSVGYGLSASAAGYALLLVLSQPMDGRLYLGRLLGISAPANLQRTWWMDKTTGKYLEKCHVKEGFSSGLMKECLEVAAGKRGTLYLIGDSHARNYLPALRDAFREHSAAYLTMGSGCAFLPPAMSSKFVRVRCPDYVAETAEYLLQRVHSGDVVFAGQRLSGAEDKQTPLYVDFIKAFAVRLGEKGVPLVLLDGIYPAALGPEQCIELPWRPFRSEGCSAAFETVQKAFARFDRLALDASGQVANLFYAPLRTGLCHEGACGQATATGLPIWHDRSHITEGAAAELAPLLRTRLAQQGFFQRFPAEP